jgi:hypothetical protein
MSSASTGAVCKLEIKETLEGTIQREMQSTMKAFEEKILGKMEERMESIRIDLVSKVNSVADEQRSLRLKIDGMLDEALAVRTDTLAMEEEVNHRVESLSQDCFAMRVDTLAIEEELTARLDALVKEVRTDLQGLTAQETKASTAISTEVSVIASNKLQKSDDVTPATIQSTKQRTMAEEEQSMTEATESTAFNVPWAKVVKCPSNSSGFSYSFKVPHSGGFQAPSCLAPSAMSNSRFYSEGLRGLRPSRSSPLLVPLM